MTRLLFILLLSCLPAFGQMTTVIPKDWTGLHGLVTNQTGYPLLAWYKSADYYTNTGVATLPDSWTNQWHLTNVTEAAFPTGVPNDLNGYTTIQFDGSNDYLNTVLYTNVQPSEVWLVFFLTETNGNTTQFLFDGARHTTGRQVTYISGGKLQMFSGKASSFETDVRNFTNQWTCLSTTFNEPISQAITNGVVAKTGLDSGAYPSHGVMLSATWNQVANNFTKYKLAELIAFGNGSPTPGTNVVARSNIWYYINQKYSR